MVVSELFVQFTQPRNLVYLYRYLLLVPMFQSPQINYSATWLENRSFWTYEIAFEERCCSIIITISVMRYDFHMLTQGLMSTAKTVQPESIMSISRLVRTDQTEPQTVVAALAKAVFVIVKYKFG